ncbi:MAG: hypothetical protein ACYC0V_21510, partial [Armatimonadota bacterium]
LAVYSTTKSRVHKPLVCHFAVVNVFRVCYSDIRDVDVGGLLEVSPIRRTVSMYKAELLRPYGIIYSALRSVWP